MRVIVVLCVVFLAIASSVEYVVYPDQTSIAVSDKLHTQLPSKLPRGIDSLHIVYDPDRIQVSINLKPGRSYLTRQYAIQNSCLLIDSLFPGTVSLCSNMNSTLGSHGFKAALSKVPVLHRLAVSRSGFQGRDILTGELAMSNMDTTSIVNTVASVSSRTLKTDEFGVLTGSWSIQSHSEWLSNFWKYYETDEYPVRGYFRLWRNKEKLSVMALGVFEKIDSFLPDSKVLDSETMDMTKLALPELLLKSPRCTAQLNRTLEGAGFHQRIAYQVNVSPELLDCISFQTGVPIEEISCSLGVLEVVPPQAYVDIYELDQKSGQFLVLNDADIEKPSNWGQQNQVLSLSSEVTLPGNVSLELPVHFRYQNPGDSGLVSFDSATLHYKCHSKKSGANPCPYTAGSIFVKQSVEDVSCDSWHRISVEESSSLKYVIPVGDMNHAWFVNYVTYGSTVAAFFVLVHIILKIDDKPPNKSKTE